MCHHEDQGAEIHKEFSLIMLIKRGCEAFVLLETRTVCSFVLLKSMFIDTVIQQ